jgi:hypothetical protein
VNEADDLEAAARRLTAGTPGSEERFAAAGRELGSRLQDELGPGHRVEYEPEPTRPPGVRPRNARGPWLGLRGASGTLRHP